MNPALAYVAIVGTILGVHMLAYAWLVSWAVKTEGTE